MDSLAVRNLSLSRWFRSRKSMKACVPSRVVSRASLRDLALPNSEMTGSNVYAFEPGGTSGAAETVDPRGSTLAADECVDLIALRELRVEGGQAGKAGGDRRRSTSTPLRLWIGKERTPLRKPRLREQQRRLRLPGLGPDDTQARWTSPSRPKAP